MLLGRKTHTHTVPYIVCTLKWARYDKHPPYFFFSIDRFVILVPSQAIWLVNVSEGAIFLIGGHVPAWRIILSTAVTLLSVHGSLCISQSATIPVLRRPTARLPAYVGTHICMQSQHWMPWPSPLSLPTPVKVWRWKACSYLIWYEVILAVFVW